MSSTPKSQEELSAELHEVTAKLNELLHIADDLMIPVHLILNTKGSESKDEITTTLYVRALVYKAIV